MTDRTILARELYNFEGLYSRRLETMHIGGFNAWQAVKADIFFTLVSNRQTGQRVADREKGTARRNTRQSSAIAFRLAGDLLYSAFAYLRFRLRPKGFDVYFHARSVDKLAKQKDGLYYNYLMDGFIVDNKVDNFLYGEKSDNGNFKRPARVKPGLSIDRFNSVIGLNMRFFSAKREITPLAEGLADLLNAHFAANNIPETVDANTLHDRLTVFRAEYKCWKVLLKAIKPRLVICSEMTGTGFMAACRGLDLRSVDLQHGVIDRYHAQYMYHPVLKPIKRNMAIPSHIGVFGALHKDSILTDRFWEETEIVVLGHRRVQFNRQNYKGLEVEKALTNTVLLPTQWPCFEQTKEMLESYLAANKQPFKILLKLHPLEPEDNCSYYKDLAETHSDLITLADKDIDIYRLITRVPLVVGFDSAVLLETVSLGRPCITLTTPFSPRGILSLFSSDALAEAILPVRYNDIMGLTQLIEQSIGNTDFYKDWIRKTDKLSDYLYSCQYRDNCSRLVSQSLLNKTA